MSTKNLSLSDQFEADLRADRAPDNPITVLASWLDTAWSEKYVPNPNTMTLASVGENGPSARIVLCKSIAAVDGYIVFYTNYDSRKGCELRANAQAAAVFHFDHQGRQVRLEGMVVPSPTAESDAYFASRALGSQLGALASDQSQPIADRAALEAQLAVRSRKQEGDSDIERPANWGGYRLWARTVELWCDGRARLHDRFRFDRKLERRGETLNAGPWTAARLQP